MSLSNVYTALKFGDSLYNSAKVAEAGPFFGPTSLFLNFSIPHIFEFYLLNFEYIT